jgi:hypothetical protein
MGNIDGQGPCVIQGEGDNVDGRHRWVGTLRDSRGGGGAGARGGERRAEQWCTVVDAKWKTYRVVEI